jgi:putative NADH-flavin reductase
MKTVRYALIALLTAACLLPSAHAAEAKKIVVYGASARIGHLIVEEALRRGHHVVGVSRTPEKLTFEDPDFTAVSGDVTGPASVRAVVAGADAIIVSVSGNAPGNAPEDSAHNRAAKTMIVVLGEMGEAGPRVLQMGGATTIHETREAMLANLPFPAEPGSPMYGMLFGHLEALHNYRASDIKWTVITPPNEIIGYRGGTDQRTGKYRTGTDALVTDAAGRSSITVSDLAVATVDEVENGRFIRQRFTVGY